MAKRVSFSWLGSLICCSFVFIALFFIVEPRGVTSSPLPVDSIYELRVAPEESSPPRANWGLKRVDGSAAGFHAMAARQSHPPSDAPVLIITGSNSPFGSYYAEILRAEGLNLFAVADVEDLTAQRLVSTDVVILTVSDLNKEIVQQLATWVRAGGNLIAFRPEGNLLPLFGIGPAGDPVADSYILFDRGSEPGQGIVRESLQLRVPAAKFELKAGVAAIAHLYETATKSLGLPAITLRNIEHGHVAAYAYDLAESIIRTRQGNPDWINQERDGFPPRRANDLFYPDYTDMDKIGIPQADEQQRFFANLILAMNRGRRPLPRFWYLPEGRRAVIILASDDHGSKGGTRDSFTRLSAESPPGCRVEVWECYRATSYLTPNTPMGSDNVKRYEAQGFEIGVHADTGCTDQDISTVSSNLSEQMRDYGKKELGIQKQETHRLHCIPWNGWTDTVKVERDHGIRFSLNYYYWPESWIQGKQGFMTGSGFPMRFADLDGKVLDIYQAATHIVDENGIKYAKSVGYMINKALGPEQFFGMFGTHYDFRDDFLSTAIRIAKERGVALISASQALRWIDARSNSRFERVAWKQGTLSFDVHVEAETEAMTVMIPLWSSERRIVSIECDGDARSYHTVRIKGLDYASLPLRSGSCVAMYSGQISSASN
jgi:hypothetical protein